MMRNELEMRGLKDLIKEIVKEELEEINERLYELENQTQETGEDIDEQQEEKDALEEEVGDGGQVDQETMKKLSYNKGGPKSKKKKDEDETDGLEDDGEFEDE